MEQKKDTAEMEPTHMLLGEHAEGKIEAGPEQQERLDEMTARLAAGEFHGEAKALIPVICIDGRFCRHGDSHMLPNAAGGTISIFVADDLTDKDYAGPDGTTVEGYKRIMQQIVAQGGLVGGHDDDGEHPEGSGCGANDRLPHIYAFLARKGGDIRTLAAKLGVSVSDTVFEKIVGNATARTQFSGGAEMLGALDAQDGEVVVERLGGAHKEVVAVINTKEGTTLDRKALLDEFGEDYEAFNVDVWSFQHAAELLTDNEEKQKELVAAMVFYNLATAHVLGGKNLRVVTL